MIRDKDPSEIEWPDIEQILQQHRIKLEPMLFRGYIDYTLRLIAINPACDKSIEEIAVHEALHFYTEEYIKKHTSEDYVKMTARKLNEDEELSNRVRNYVYNKAVRIPKKEYLM